MPEASVAGFQRGMAHVFQREKRKKNKRHGGTFLEEQFSSDAVDNGSGFCEAGNMRTKTPLRHSKSKSLQTSTRHSKKRRISKRRRVIKVPLRLFPNILYVVKNHPFMDYFTISGSSKMLHLHMYKFLLLKDDYTLKQICRNNHLKQLFPSEVLSKQSSCWFDEMIDRKRIRSHYNFICHHINAASAPENYSGGYFLQEFRKADRDVRILTCNNTRSLKLFCLRHGFSPVNRNIFLLTRRDLINMSEDELLHIYQNKWRAFPSMAGRIYEQLISQLIFNKNSFRDMLMQSFQNDENSPGWIHDYNLNFHEKILDDLEDPTYRHGKHSLDLLLNGDTGRLVFCQDRHRVDILGLLEVKEGTESHKRFGPHKIPLVVQITHQQIKLLKKLFTDWISNDVFHFTRNSGLSHAISNFYLLHDRQQTNKKIYRVVRVIAAHHLDSIECNKFLNRIEKRRRALHSNLMRDTKRETGARQMEPENTFLSVWSMETNPMYQKYWKMLSERQL